MGTFIFPNGTTCSNQGIGNIGCNNNGNFNLGCALSLDISPDRIMFPRLYHIVEDRHAL